MPAQASVKLSIHAWPPRHVRRALAGDRGFREVVAVQPASRALSDPLAGFSLRPGTPVGSGLANRRRRVISSSKEIDRRGPDSAVASSRHRPWRRKAGRVHVRRSREMAAMAEVRDLALRARREA